MRPEEMQRLFERHRDAEAARDYDAILATFVEDCFLETHPLGLRSEGRAATRTSYEGYFTAFPDLTPDDEDHAFGDDVMVVWGTLRVRAVATGSACLARGAPSLSRLRTSLRSAMG